MRDVVRRLDGAGLEVASSGGKAAALDQLIGQQVPVPSSAVVLSSVYRDVLHHSGLEPFVEELTRSAPPKPADAEAEDRRVDAAFLAIDLPSALEEQLLAAAEQVGRADDHAVAVRSSATAEDGAASSFAGQYRSLLDVRPDELSRSVRLVWASLWSSAARSYRQARGVDEAQIGMAVLLMRMVEPESSGVLFTVDPQGSASDMRIEMVEGRGDKLVAGATSAPSFIAARDTPSDFAGHTDVPLEQVATLGSTAEQLFGSPQDIEWAVEDGQPLLLQSRAITTAPSGAVTDDIDAHLAPDATYTTAGIEEALPGVLTPLAWSINAPMMEHAFRAMFDRLGHVPRYDQQIVNRAWGRAVINLDALRAVAGAAGGTVTELEGQLFGDTAPDSATQDEMPGGEGGVSGKSSESGEGRAATVPRTPGRPRRSALTWLRTVQLRQSLRREAAVVRAAADRLVDERLPIDHMDAAELVTYREQLHELAGRATTCQVAVASTAAAAFRSLESFLQRYLPEEATELAQTLTAVDAASSGGANLQVNLRGVDPRGLREPGDDISREVAEQARLAARRAGSQAVYGGTTWEERMDDVWATLEARAQVADSPSPARRNPDEALAGVQHQLSSARAWKVKRRLTGQVVDIRLRLLRRLVADASALLSLREQTKLALLRLGGECRRTTRRAAQLLHQTGELTDEDDIDLLTEAELTHALRTGPAPAPTKLEQRRAALQDCTSRDLARRFVGRPTDARTAASPDTGTSASSASSSDRLRGQPAGPGRYRGRPQVVQSLQSANLEPGDVLVARSTDPSWTPLLLQAGAIVVEEGGLLSHAAIVARELGVPAVANVPGATARLADADVVTVDGGQGVVQVHDTDHDPGSDPGSDDDIPEQEEAPV